jgi:glycosyltransferase involved in cell wall biosynthesis
MITTDRNGTSRREGEWYETTEAGINVHWLVLPYRNEMPFAERMKAFWRFAVKSGRRAAGVDCDVVFATSTPLTIALPGVYVARRRGVPLVFEVRDLWPELPIAVGALRGRVPIRAARSLERFAYRNSSRVVALSPGMKDGVVNTGYPEEQVDVIPNCSDLHHFDVPADKGAALRAHYPWLQDRPLVLYAGTLGEINGVDYLVRLAAAMRPVAPEVRFLVIGAGKQKAHVRELAVSLDVLDRNFFMMDPVTKADMPSWFSAATIATSLFIDLPPMWANSANKFFDALAAGRPIAINYRGWQAELLERTQCGFVLDALDVRRAADHLVALWVRSYGPRDALERHVQQEFAAAGWSINDTVYSAGGCLLWVHRRHPNVHGPAQSEKVLWNWFNPALPAGDREPHHNDLTWMREASGTSLYCATDLTFDADRLRDKWVEDGFFIVIPHALLFLLFATPGLTFSLLRVVGRVRSGRRSAACLCPSCGYDMRASPGRCPECGPSDR